MSEFDSSTPAGSETPAASQPATPTAPVGSGAPAITSAPPVASPSTPQIPEGYVPSHRIREVTERARAAEQKYQSEQAALNARYNEMERKFNALAGVTPPPNPEIQQVRSRFNELYPGLSKMEERAADILGVLERSGDLESQNQHYWQSYGRQTMDRLFSKAAETYGGQLSDEGKRLLHSSFVGYVQQSPELAQRYANDPSIVEDFWKAYTSSFIDPARRAAQANVEGRVGGVPALPRDTPSGAPRPTPAPQAKTLEDKAAAAWAQYQSTARDRDNR